VILAARQGWHTDQLCRAAAERGARATVLAYEPLVARVRTGGGTLGPAEGPALQGADAVLARIIPNGSLEQIIYRVDALHWLEDAGLRVVNSPRAIERSVDKFYTTALLSRAGLATPETVVCERSDDAIAAFRAMGDVIVKPLFGSMGLGMVRVTDEEMAFRVFRTLDQIRAVYYLQRTIDHDGRDVRAFVVGDRVLGAIERTSPAGGPQWRTNVSRGGEARTVALSDAWAAMAIAAARAVGAEYAGVDLLPARDGTVYALEVNAIPGWQGLERATGIDVAGAILDLVCR
jgi:RimK family alpha-L-glutamate ligase